MQLLYDFLPIVLFFIAYKFAGVYVATSAAIFASILQVAIYRWRFKTYEKMQVITLVLIMLLGGATLILHNPIFIKWKPTVLDWVFAGIFLASQFIGQKPLIRYVMEKKVNLPDKIWTQLNLSWVLFFFLMGAANIYVVYHYSTDTWVNFKLFGMLGLTFAFVLVQALYLSKYVDSSHE